MADSKRVDRALDANFKVELDIRTMMVKGNTNTYAVVLEKSGTARCSCPDHTYRQSECKHIKFVKMQLDKEKPECPYGKDCYRKNKTHFVEFRHPHSS